MHSLIVSNDHRQPARIWLDPKQYR